MAQRGASVADVRKALATAAECKPSSEHGRWRATGVDLDGDELTAVVAFEGLVVVVTMF